MVVISWNLLHLIQKNQTAKKALNVQKKEFEKTHDINTKVVLFILVFVQHHFFRITIENLETKFEIVTCADSFFMIIFYL